VTAGSDPLSTYLAKRNFSRTPEPRGSRPKPHRQPLFVVQKHAARALHYDFRIEVDGVLKSWAVPKGPPKDPSEKRLALPTEDHPLEYAEFEGVIPEGEYGAGKMAIWDLGTYRTLADNDNAEAVPMARAIANGRVRIWVDGKKLHGGYALTRMGSGRRVRWLLVKMKDEQGSVRRSAGRRTAAASQAKTASMDRSHARRTD
jgi:DNA ligase D-like protein (predicted 3'-phosphoesterase)